MKSFVFFIFLTATMAACTPPEKGGIFGWSYLKSPNTGRCYEVLTAGRTVGISEIPCSEAKFN